MKTVARTLLVIALLTPALLRSQSASPQDGRARWTDSVYRSLTPDQRIAQLLVVRVWPWKDSVYCDSVVSQIRTFNVGGVCLFKGSPVKQALLTNRLQNSVQTPLLVTTDAEWGLGMRMDSAFFFPRQMALGAIRDDSLIYTMGTIIGRGCRRMGIQVNFAPVADVNNNPANPVIGFRSFGENPELVARKSSFYMKGLQDAGVMATAKHFPGHGDTDTDSHLTLPVIKHPVARLDSVELLPFRRLIRDGAQGVMVAHLFIRSIDTTANTPSTLSYNIITRLLKERLGFKGYVVTDALDMQGVAKFFKPGEIEVKALQAGNDILLLPQNTETAIRGIRTAIDSGWLSDSLVQARCRRMLELKYDLGLSRIHPVDTRNLVADLNPVEAQIITAKMVSQSMTLVKNTLMLVPLTGLERRKIAVLCIGDSLPCLFQETVARYAPVDLLNIPKRFKKACADSIAREAAKADIVLIGLFGISSTGGESHGITPEMGRLIDTVSRINRTALALFGTPYALARVPGLSRIESVLVAYQDNEYTQKAAAEALMGGIPAQGRLPVSAASFPFRSGETTEKNRLSIVLPEEIGIPRSRLDAIDSIASEGLRKRAYPGCRVLLAKDGQIFYDKAFGTLRYGDSIAVDQSTLFDLASVTKVAATTLAIMKLYDDGRIALTDTLGKFLPFLRGSNKGGLRIEEVMTHQAGLQDWIPFYKETLSNGRPDPAIYSASPSADHPVRVAQGLYISAAYRDTILRRIAASPLRSKDYKYSDLGFILLRFLTESVTGKPFETYLHETFYRPLGLTATAFRPAGQFSLSRIAPTEYDADFRHQLVWGDVHDPCAAMLGGVSGHAGLFSDAYGMAVVLQLLLNDGTYGGKRYFSPETVALFTKARFPGNRRGLGFDKPPLTKSPDGPACLSASPASFGHSGFTGTYLWADPENGLLYIFLSNRVCPDAGNQRLSSLNIRTRIHQAAYDALKPSQIK